MAWQEGFGHRFGMMRQSSKADLLTNLQGADWNQNVDKMWNPMAARFELHSLFRVVLCPRGMIQISGLQLLT